jgi:two-component system KDP operon response regulator KdpE
MTSIAPSEVSISQKHLVLAVEDDPAILRLLNVSLEGSNFRLIEAMSASSGVEMAAKRRPDLILLDLNLPDAGGIKVIEVVREWSTVPIIVVSGEGDEDLKVKALEAGADDYITKPFGVSELLARMKVAMRHAIAANNPSESAIFESGDLKIDFASRIVMVRGEQVHLTPIEYKLLTTLIRHAGKVVTHRQLLAEVWGQEYTEESQYLRVYMGYLRRKLEANPDQPQLLLTEPRIGYRLVV